MNRSPEQIEAAIGALLAEAAFMVISDKIPNTENFCDLILNEEQIKDISKEKDEFIEVFYNPNSTAYMISTSGTTGKPKCIEISRKSLLIRLDWAHRRYGLDGVILQKTVNTFDVSIWEILSVIYGARLCLLPEGYEKLPDKIAKKINEYGIEKIHFVPSMLKRFLKYVELNNVHFEKLKIVFVSGEKLEISLAKKFLKL